MSDNYQDYRDVHTISGSVQTVNMGFRAVLLCVNLIGVAYAERRDRKPGRNRRGQNHAR